MCQQLGNLTRPVRISNYIIAMKIVYRVHIVCSVITLACRICFPLVYTWHILKGIHSLDWCLSRVGEIETIAKVKSVGELLESTAMRIFQGH